MTQDDLLHEKRQVMVPSVAWRKYYTESTRAAHFKIERDKIVATIDAITPGLRPAYFRERSKRLMEHLE